ncbi:hypothetical protein DYB34_010658 [Aphanomyces astaci]|uniref:PX domain-containing protein n=2 Tax=Aphanomyces astaci TaxID=112090 RepID=A0A397EQR3_APHAT|nr:hypothetical protein DYB34_010658 [Aphanomyces astaci]RHZ03274.1 hypothetical protein DYB31_012400 [Aphanomyces astaci]
MTKESIRKSQVMPAGSPWSHPATTTTTPVGTLLVSFRDIVVRSVEPVGASNAAFVEYEVELANQKSGVVWSVRQRYSKFLEMQDAIGATLEIPHCLQCTELLEQVEELELPPKRWGLGRMWGSSSPEADTKLRARMFFVYLHALIELGSSKLYRQCPIVVKGFMKVVLAFLTPPSTPMELKPLTLQPKRKEVVHTKTAATTNKPTPPPFYSNHIVSPKAVAGRSRNNGPHKFTALATIFEQEPPIAC